jgi:hypothetical protein
VFPAFVLREFAPGLAGLAIVGLFAAAMSSIDSALNSLSASTLEDFVPDALQARRAAPVSALQTATLAWGLFAIGFSFSVEHIAGTILEAINKVGSMANGPLLALFVTAVVPACGRRAPCHRPPSSSACASNVCLWLFAPSVSWLWWNVSGCVISLALAGLGQRLRGQLMRPLGEIPATPAWLRGSLLASFAGICCCLPACSGWPDARLLCRVTQVPYTGVSGKDRRYCGFVALLSDELDCICNPESRAESRSSGDEAGGTRLIRPGQNS